MRQPSKKNNSYIVKPNNKKLKKRKIFQKSLNTSELDGSGLELFFRINFLDKLHLEYTQQFEAKSIHRFYDFLLKDESGLLVLLEIDGSYFHCDPRFYNKNNTTSFQKRNKRVDEIKNKWALDNGYKLIRFWEYDIKNNPKMILDTLSEILLKK